MTLEEQWKKYEATTLPAEASLIQRTETRRAFYAGLAAMMYGMMELPDKEVGAGEVILRSYGGEIRDFADAVLAGKA